MNQRDEAKGVNVSIEPYSVSLRIGSNAFDLGTFDIVPAANGVKETFTFTPTNKYEVTAGETYQVRMIMDIQSQDDLPEE